MLKRPLLGLAASLVVATVTAVQVLTPHFVAGAALAVTRSAADCSRAAVQAAVDAASDGDTVAVPAGTGTWELAVNISGKTITLQGAGSGAGGTKILYGGAGHSLIVIDPGKQTGRMDVSGFRLVGGDKNYWDGALRIFGPAGWKNLRIHHMVFEDNKQYSIRGYAGTCGLVDHCTFRGAAHGICMWGNGVADWTNSLVLGTDGFFFVEDNTFDWKDWYGMTGAVCFDYVDGGRVVFRYNTIRYGFFETHDRVRHGSGASANAWEIYCNSFWTDTPKWKGCDISAGTGVIWGNTFTGPWTIPIGGFDYKTDDPRGIPRCDGTDPADQNVPGESGWRSQYQIGSQGEGRTAIGYPAYIWGNTVVGGSGSNGMVITGKDSPKHIREGRDFYNNTPRPEYVAYRYPHPLQRLGEQRQNALQESQGADTRPRTNSGEDRAALRDRIERELRGWGFNTVPQPEFWERFPFAVPLDRLVAAGESRFEDAFDPAFKAWLRRKIGEACAKTKNNPNCIGY
jgi:hypothetical protein